MVISLFFSCTASATLPVPSTADQYLIGIHRVIIWSTETLDGTRFIHKGKLPRLDYPNIDNAIIAQLRSTLPERITNKIDFVAARPGDLSGSLDQDTLVIKFTFGLDVVTLQGTDLVIGAVYPTIDRPLPKELHTDRASGFHRSFTGSVPPTPFLLSGDKAAVQEVSISASRRSAGYVAMWLNHTPIDG